MAFVRTTRVYGVPMLPGRRRLGIRDRGLGAAACPSVQQLEGIVDLTDPCQQSVSATGDTVVPALTAAQAAASAESMTNIATAPTFLGVPMPYAVLGGVLLALVFVSGGGGGGRRR